MITTELPSSWSREDVASGLHISPRTVDRLVREGKASFYLAGRSKRFLAEHVAQIIAALEVKPAAPAPAAMGHLGLSPQSAARRRRTA